MTRTTVLWPAPWYTSSDPGIAYADKDGHIHEVYPGKATICKYPNFHSYQDTCWVVTVTKKK